MVEVKMCDLCSKISSIKDMMVCQLHFLRTTEESWNDGKKLQEAYRKDLCSDCAEKIKKILNKKED